MWNKFNWFVCQDCGHRFRRKSPSGFFICPKCDSRDAFPEDGGVIIHDGANRVPAKGSPEWYKGKWFRRTEKEWHEDIRSRSASPDGKRVIRNG